MRVDTRGTAVAVVCATIGLASCPAAAAAVPVAGTAARQVGCQSRVQEVAAPAGLMPYAQTRWDFDRVQALADGRGVRIAVLDSGVDATHRQLRGQVVAGKDLLYGTSDGRRDCIGHGTGVASIIAAQPLASPQKRLRGLAPGATIVPVRVSEQELIDPNATATTTPGESVDATDFAEAIDWAAATGDGKGNATVINVSLTMRDDVRQVRQAVQRAIARGVVIVAAVGNEAKDGSPTPYPAAYPGVIGVGAIGEDGMLQPFSQRGPYVDIVAPGGKITAANAHHGYQLADGTSFAAPFVSATAALIRQRFPDLTPAQVERLIAETADPAPTGHDSELYGRGVLNPYRALTETLTPTDAAPKQATVLPTKDPALAETELLRRRTWSTAFIIAAAGTAAALLVTAATIIIPRGRRRQWRPAGS